MYVLSHCPNGRLHEPSPPQYVVESNPSFRTAPLIQVVLNDIFLFLMLCINNSV